jgi:hypothetical protein
MVVSNGRRSQRDVEQLQARAIHLKKQFKKLYSTGCGALEINKGKKGRKGKQKADSCVNVATMSMAQLQEYGKRHHLWIDVPPHILPFVVARGNDYRPVELKGIDLSKGVDIRNFPRSIELFALKEEKVDGRKRLIPNLPSIDYLKQEAKRRGLTTDHWNGTLEHREQLAAAITTFDKAMYESQYPLRKEQELKFQSIKQPFEATLDTIRDQIDNLDNDEDKEELQLIVETIQDLDPTTPTEDKKQNREAKNKEVISRLIDRINALVDKNDENKEAPIKTYTVKNSRYLQASTGSSKVNILISHVYQLNGADEKTLFILVPKNDQYVNHYFLSENKQGPYKALEMSNIRQDTARIIQQYATLDYLGVRS